MNLTHHIAGFVSATQAASRQDVLEALTSTALEIASADDGGVLLVKAQGRTEVAAGTSPVVDELHAAEADLGQGPALEILNDGDGVGVTIADPSKNQRWTDWGLRCSAAGYRSLLTSRLAVDDRVYGALTVFARRPDAFETAHAEAIELFGVHASAALATAQTIDDLQAAIESRTVIGQATGIVMAMYDLDDKAAFAYLVRQSQDQNIKLRTVAADIVAQRAKARQ